MWQSTPLCFAPDHPTASGHFPGDPLIPGALLLDAALAAIGAAGSAHAVNVRVVKFLHPVRPGEPLSLRWQEVRDGVVQFECQLIRPPNLVMTGTLDFGGGT